MTASGRAGAHAGPLRAQRGAAGWSRANRSPAGGRQAGPAPSRGGRDERCRWGAGEPRKGLASKRQRLRVERKVRGFISVPHPSSYKVI